MRCNRKEAKDDKSTFKLLKTLKNELFEYIKDVSWKMSKLKAKLAGPRTQLIHKWNLTCKWSIQCFFCVLLAHLGFETRIWNLSLELRLCTSVHCTTLCTVVQCTLYCVQLYRCFLLNRKWIITCSTCQLRGVKTWLVVSFYLTFVLVRY